MTGRFSANSARVRLDAACAGLGIGLLPEVLLRRPLQEGRLCRVLPDYAHKPVGLYAVYPNRAQRSLAAVALVDFFIAKVAAENKPLDHVQDSRNK